MRQRAMIARVCHLCRLDERLVAAMMYGSFAQFEGDEFSDIEFIHFFYDEVLGDVDQEEWVARIAPVELYFVNEFGNGTAIFENLIRGEFHFDKASDIQSVDESWKETDWFPSLEATLVLDRTGELSRRLQKIVGPPLDRHTPEQIRFLCNCFVNWFLFGSNLLMRGELARSLDLLGIVQDQLLRMVRVSEYSTEHWFNPSKRLEKDISEASYARYVTCMAELDEGAL
jgi:lincosamide nucleotidyltransferase